MEYISIDKLSLDALPLQVYDSLMKAIVSQRLRYLEQLPPALDVAEQFNISLSYVKRAYQMLQSEGMVTATKGRGTFVTYRPRYTIPLSRLLNFRSYLEPASSIEVKVMLYDTIKDHPVIYPTLGLKEGESVFVIKRMIFHEKRPFAYQHIFLPKRYHVSYRKSYLNYTRLYDFLSNHHQNIISSVQTQGSAIVGEEKITRLLGLPTGSMLHMLRSDVLDIHHLKVATILTYLSGEHIALEVTI